MDATKGLVIIMISPFADLGLSIFLITAVLMGLALAIGIVACTNHAAHGISTIPLADVSINHMAGGSGSVPLTNMSIDHVHLNGSTDIESNVAETLNYSTLPATETTPLPFCLILAAMMILPVVSVLERDIAVHPLRKHPKRVTIESLMENETRAVIMQTIEARPGITFSELRRAVARSPRTVLQQLSILQRFGRIRSREIRHNTAFFDGTTSDVHDTADYFASNRGYSRILQKIGSNPGRNLVDLCGLLDLPRSTIARKLQILESYHIITVSREGKNIVAIKLESNVSK